MSNLLINLTSGIFFSPSIHCKLICVKTNTLHVFFNTLADSFISYKPTQAWAKYANSTPKGPSQPAGLNPELLCCEETELTTSQPCHQHLFW